MLQQETLDQDCKFDEIIQHKYSLCVRAKCLEHMIYDMN